MADAPRKKKGLDVGRQPIGTVYARALLGAAQEVGQTDAVVAEFDSLVADVLERFPNLEATLASPRIAHEEKVRILTRVFQSRMSPLVLTFLKVVSSHGRLDCLRAIHRAAKRLKNEIQGRVEVRLTTAERVVIGLAQRIADSLRTALGSEIELSSAVEADLIGGAVVRVGDTVYDGSVANRLGRLRADALQQTAREIQGALERFVPPPV